MSNSKPYPSKQGFPTRIRPNPVELSEVKFSTAKITPFSYRDTHKLMMRLESIDINFKQTFRSCVTTEPAIENQLNYNDPFCFPCRLPSGEIILCPRGNAWDIQTKQLTLEINSKFIPFGKKILSSHFASDFIEYEDSEYAPKADVTYGGGFPKEDLEYYNSVGNVWDPIPTDFSHWWFKRFSPRRYFPAMRTEYSLIDQFDSRTNTTVTNYGNQNEYLTTGVTYRAIKSTGLVRPPISLDTDPSNETPNFESNYTFSQICECVNPNTSGPYYFKNPESGTLNFFSTGSMEFYTEKDSSFLGDLDRASMYMQDTWRKFFVVFSTPVFTQQWVPAYTYRTEAGNGRYLNCVDYVSYSYPNPSPLLINNPVTFSQVEIDDSGGTKTLPVTNGVKLYAVINNYKPEYVGDNLTEFFGTEIITGGTYRSYKIEFPSGTALPLNFNMWVHTYREPKVLPNVLVWAEATPTEENPCLSENRFQPVPNDEFDEPQITVTLKFQSWGAKYDRDTGAWV